MPGSQYDPSCNTSSSSHHHHGPRCLLDAATGSCSDDDTTLGKEMVKDFFGPGRAPTSGSSHGGGGNSGGKVAPWDWWKAGIVKYFGAGLWWSTERTGECTGGSGVPAGCSWRVVKELKRVPKLCADASIGEYIQAADKNRCFGACPATERHDSSSGCWINCFFQTLLGPGCDKSLNGTGAMPLADAVTAWERPFSSTDTAKGGCPSI
jgi:hypothetical protein